MNDEEKTSTFQKLRNVAYALSAVLGIYGFAVDEAIIEPIVVGIVALFGIATDVLAWWYSRRSVLVAPGRREASPVSE